MKSTAIVTEFETARSNAQIPEFPAFPGCSYYSERCLKLRPWGMTAWLLVLSLGTEPLWASDPFPKFDAVTIDPEIGKVCYALTLADVDGDGKLDIVAVSENRVLWYQAPDWQPRVIIADQVPLDHVCIDALDIDRDGQVDFALGAGWTRAGSIHWLKRRASLDEPWAVHFIAEERSVHRMRFADVLGRGRPQLVVSPLLASQGMGVRLLALEIPPQPADDRWPVHILSDNLNRMHNHWHDEFAPGTLMTLTASREGVHQIERAANGDWSQVLLGRGIEGDSPDASGAGEIKVGRLKTGEPYIVTVEPMHGHTLVVRTRESANGRWIEHTVDSGFKRGHALWCADIDGDGREDIVFGHSDTPEVFGVTIYRCADDTATVWEKHVIDSGGMATEDLVVGDLTGDGLLDIVAGGRATRNVKLYVQRRAAPEPAAQPVPSRLP